MLILALETSTELGSCALWRDGVVTERTCPPGKSHSETLLPLVREVLGEAGVKVGQLDAIAFGSVPVHLPACALPAAAQGWVAANLS
jgi:tRNA threonylcarbamoyladenosine biosynthesis protein TsaB